MTGVDSGDRGTKTVLHPTAPTTWRERTTDIRRNALFVPGLVALALSIGYLFAPLMGGDLSAQMARADFAQDHGSTPIDFRWFGGTVTFGYSLWTAPVMAVVGPRVLAAIATIVATLATTRLFQRAGARRPVLGGVAAAVCQASSMVEGRTTFNVGMALGLCALLTLRHTTVVYRVVTVLLVVAAAAASPVAALLLWVCAGALLLLRRYTDSVTLVAASAVPVAVMSLLFGDNGVQVFGSHDFQRAVAATVIVALVMPRTQRIVQWGALIGLVMVVSAYLIPTPVGANAIRLSLIFAVPVVAALGRWRGWAAIGTVAVVAVVQSPITFGTLDLVGSPATRAGFYAPLVAEIKDRGPLTGRVQVPEITGHWEAVYLAREVPLARGWLRQTDVKLNDEYFYDQLPTEASYRRFLDGNNVQYVALPKARLTYYGSRERLLLQSRPDYLTEEWSDADWVLYSVVNHNPIVSYPGSLIRYDADQIVVDAPPNATIRLGIRWFRWLTVNGPGEACIAPSGRYAELRTQGTGAHYTISSTLLGNRNHC